MPGGTTGPNVARSASGRLLAEGPPGADGAQGPPGPGGGLGGLGTQPVSNGLNSNIPTSGLLTLRLTGPSAAFSVGGFTAPGPSGSVLLLIINTTAQPMTIVPEDVSSAAANRIDTLSGAPVPLPARKGSALFIYDTTSSRWVLQSNGLQYPDTLHGRDSVVRADGIELDDGAMTAGSAILHSPSASFDPVLDPGKLVVVMGAGASGAPLVTSFASVTDGQHAVLNAAASTTTTAVTTGADGTMTAGSLVLTSASANWVAGDVNKVVAVPGAGPAAATLLGQIAAVGGAHSVTLNVAAATNVTTSPVTYGGGVRTIYGTDDTANLVAAAAAASAPGAQSAVVQLPAGIILHTGIVWTYSGVTLRGSSIGGQGVTNPTRLVLANAASNYAIETQALQVKIENLWIDGSQLPAHGPIDLEPLTSTLTIERCLISGAKPHVGDLLYVGGGSEVDNVRVSRTLLFQDPQNLGTSAKARSAASVTFNSQAFNNNLDHVGIFDTDWGVYNQSGSWNVRHAQVFNQSSGFGIVFYEAAQPFELVDIYTERNDGANSTLLTDAAYQSVPFIASGNGFAVNGNAVIHVRQCIINGKNPLDYGGKQPISLESNRLGGNVVLAKAAPPAGGSPIGIYRMQAKTTVFTDPTVGFTGDLSMVDQYGTQGNLGNDFAHGGYGIDNRDVNRLGTNLEVAGAFTASGSESEHCTILDVLPFLHQTNFNGTAQLIGWYDAGKGVTSVSGRVSAWQDQSGNGYTLSQPTAGLRPTYHPTPPAAWVAWSSGGNEALFGPFAQPVGITNPFEILAVIRDDQTGFQLVDTANAYTGVNTGGAGALQPHGTALFNATEPGGGPTQDLVADIVFNGASSAVGYNGAADITGNTGVIGLGPNLTLGNQHGASPGAEWSGRMYELLFVNVALSSTYRQQAAFALATKWGITWSGGSVPQLAYTCDTQVDAFGNIVPDAVVVSKSACGIVATLPPATSGRTIKFVDWTGKAGSVAPITVQGNGGATVNGGSSVTMSVDNGAIIVWSPDGFTWVATMTQAGGGGGGVESFGAVVPSTVCAAATATIIATARIVVGADGVIDAHATLLTGGTLSGTSYVVSLLYNAHGSGLGGATFLNDSQVNIPGGGVSFADVAAVVTGLTPGADLDFYLVMTATGGSFITAASAVNAGGVVARSVANTAAASDGAVSASIAAGQVLTAGVAAIVAQVTIVAPASGMVEVVASAGPGGATQAGWTSQSIGLFWNTHGGGLDATKALDGGTMDDTGAALFLGLSAIKAGLTPGVQYDFLLMEVPTGGDFHTSGTPNQNGGITARPL